MNKTQKTMFDDLQAKIEASYTEGVTMEEAERLAGLFLHATMTISSELRKADLDARMRKSGTKAVRAAIYLNILKNNDKKPTEAQMAATIDTDEIVMGEQKGLDEAEVDRSELERLYDVFNNAHIFFRGVAKGNFGA